MRTSRALTIICLAGAVVGLVGVAQTPVWAQTDTQVEVRLTDTDPVSPGNRTAVDVRIGATAPVYGVEFSIQASSSAVRITNLSQGSYLRQNGSSIVIVSRTDGATAAYSETRIGTDAGVAGAGLLAEFDVTVPQSVTAQSVEINVTSIQVVDPEAEELPTETTNATIPINQSDSETGQTPTPTDTPDVTPTPTATPSGTATPTGDNDSDSAPPDEGGTPAQSTVTPTATEQSSGSGGATRTPSVELSELIDNSTATPTQSSQSSWQQTVTDRVLQQMQRSDSTPVLIQLRPTGELDPILNRLNSSGLTEVRANTQLRTVRAKADNESIKNVARFDSVSRIRYISTQSQQTANATATQGDPQEPTTRSTTRATQANQAQETSYSQTGAAGPGFGIVSVIVAMCFGVLYLLAHHQT